MFFFQEPIPTSLLRLSADYVSKAMKMFIGVLKYMGEGADPITDVGRIDIAYKLLN